MLVNPRPIYFIFFIISLSCGYILYLRFPNALTYPNFYAEDGQYFILNIYNKGLWQSLLEPLNGKLISVLYLWSALAIYIKDALNLPFYVLPKILALVTYSSYGLILSSPILFFARTKPSIIYWSIFSLLTAMVPIGPFQYEITWVLGNTKWIYLYLAFLSFTGRSLNRESKIYVVISDFVILASFFTLPSVLIIYLFQFVLEAKRFFYKRTCDFGCISFLVTGAIALVPLYHVLFTNVIVAGYLDAPMIWTRAIEIILARPILYPIAPQLYTHLNDKVVIAILGLLFWGLMKFREKRSILFFGIVASVLATILFVSARPGISELFNNYTWPSFSRFFYGQNLIVIFLVGYIFERKRKLGPLLLLLLFVAYLNEDYRRPSTNFMYESVGDLRANISRACKSVENINDNQILSIAIYPKDLEIFVSSSLACK